MALFNIPRIPRKDTASAKKNEVYPLKVHSNSQYCLPKGDKPNEGRMTPSKESVHSIVIPFIQRNIWCYEQGQTWPLSSGLYQWSAASCIATRDCFHLKGMQLGDRVLKQGVVTYPSFSKRTVTLGKWCHEGQFEWMKRVWEKRVRCLTRLEM